MRPELPPELARALAEASKHDRALAAELATLAEELRSHGLGEEAARIESAGEQASLLGRLGERLGGLKDRLREAASRHWQLFSRELHESRELLSLLTRRLTGEIPSFSPEEESLVRRQLADLLRTVPATALVAAPVPGIALVTPFVLKKLNLLPSAWREAHLLAELERTSNELAARGHHATRERLDSIRRRLEARQNEQAERIRLLRQHPELRLLYDANDDGVLDDSEWKMINDDRQALGERVRSDSGAPEWYVSTDGHVGDPLRLSDLLELPLPEHTLVRGRGMQRWLPIELLHEIAATPG